MLFLVTTIFLLAATCKGHNPVSMLSNPTLHRALQGTTTCDSLIQENTAPLGDELIWADFWYQEGTRECTCLEQDDGFSLSCSFCPLCDPAGVCAVRAFDTLYNLDGGQLKVVETFNYTKVRDEQVRLEVEWNFNLGAYECSASVDDVTCQSCSFEPCDRGDGPIFDLAMINCTNVPDGDVLDRCTEDVTRSNPHDGVFTIINDNVVCQDSSGQSPDPSGATRVSVVLWTVVALLIGWHATCVVV